MTYDKRPRNAALYRVDDGTVTCVAEGLTICNGPAFDEPQGRLYLADTALFIVDVFRLDPPRAPWPAAGVSSTSPRCRSGRTA
jgi:sugar lactone lactonase YvrE